jgi:NADH:ubiquinone oxidoreductase subunit E
MSNKQFSLVEEECIAACANAPCAVVGTKYLLDITPDQVGKIVDDLTANPHPESEVV